MVLKRGKWKRENVGWSKEERIRDRVGEQRGCEIAR